MYIYLCMVCVCNYTHIIINTLSTIAYVIHYIILLLYAVDRRGRICLLLGLLAGIPMRYAVY